jgi:hypothetical protein
MCYLLSVVSQVNMIIMVLSLLLIGVNMHVAVNNTAVKCAFLVLNLVCST